MTCEKCGLVVTQPEKICPRCGEIFPKQETQRSGVESGSLDAWSDMAAESDTRGRRAMPHIPVVSKFTEKHPSAPFFMGAVAFRMSFYILSLLTSLFTDFSFWSGWGIIINIFIAIVAVLLVAIPPDEQDIYLFRIISTTLIVLDACIVIMSWILPYILKIVATVF